MTTILILQLIMLSFPEFSALNTQLTINTSEGLRRKANRIHRGLYRCKSCGGELNADINAALNIMKQVIPNSVTAGNGWNSGDIISPSRIRLVEFV